MNNSIKETIQALSKELEDAEEKVKDLRNKIIKIQYETCPHKNQKKEYVQDGFEFKERPFCCDCGVEL